MVMSRDKLICFIGLFGIVTPMQQTEETIVDGEN